MLKVDLPVAGSGFDDDPCIDMAVEDEALGLLKCTILYGRPLT